MYDKDGYIVATEDNTHFLGIFGAPTPEVILGSNLIKLTLAKIMAHIYGMDEQLWKEAIAPVKPATFIGPPEDFNREIEHPPYQDRGYLDQFTDQLHPYTFQYPTHNQI